jgi:hypothetical protein
MFAPMPSASVSTATAVKPGFFSNWRKANRTSVMFYFRCSLSVVSGQTMLQIPEANSHWRMPKLQRNLNSQISNHCAAARRIGAWELAPPWVLVIGR